MHRHRLAFEQSGEFGRIGCDALDDRTWEDLNLDAVAAAIDRTTSTLGQEALYHRLRTTPSARQRATFEALIGRFTADPAARERAQLALGRLQDKHGYDLWWLAEPGAVATRSWYVFFPLISVGTLLCVGVMPLWVNWVPVVALAMAVNLVVRSATDQRIGKAAGAFRQLAPLIAAAQALRPLAGDGIEPIAGCLDADVPGLARLKTVSRWVSANPFMLPADAGWLGIWLTELTNAVYEYFNLFFLLDGNAVYFGAADLTAHAAALLRVVAAMGDVDAALSVASLRAGTTSWTRPRFMPPGSPTTLIGVRHPLIAEAVPNSIRLAPPHGVLITGSNMSGKTTFLRTLGVTVVMAQTLNTCFAASYEAPELRVRSVIGRSDDIESGQSYYLAEVEAVVALVQASALDVPHLFLFDEMFRGTNAIERIAAGEAVLHWLVASRRHIVAAATHDGELVDMLDGEFAPYHFTDAIGAGGLVFDFRLQPGPATTRNAIALLKQRGAPDALVSRARARAAALDQARAL